PGERPAAAPHAQRTCRGQYHRDYQRPEPGAVAHQILRDDHDETRHSCGCRAKGQRDTDSKQNRSASQREQRLHCLRASETDLVAHQFRAAIRQLAQKLTERAAGRDVAYPRRRHRYFLAARPSRNPAPAANISVRAGCSRTCSSSLAVSSSTLTLLIRFDVSSLAFACSWLIVSSALAIPCWAASFTFSAVSDV